MAQATLLGGDGVTGETGATHNTKANANFTELYGATAAAQADADAANSALSTHISDPSAAHEGSAISFTPAGGLSSTDVQAAIVELAGAGGVGSATTTSEGIVELLTPAEVIIGTDTTRAATAEGIHGKVVGVQDIFIPASAMWPRQTNGCAFLQQSEVATSLFNIQSLDFDTTTQEFAQFQVALPRKWNNGTVTYEVYWTAISGTGGVVFGLSGGAYSNDDALTVAFGTAITVTDTLIATSDLHITPTSAAVTLAGTPASADFLGLQLSRNPADGSDTIPNDVKVLGVMFHLTTTAAKDA